MTQEEMELRIKYLEWALLQISGNIWCGICVNASLDNNNHPHWVPNPYVHTESHVIHLPQSLP